MPKLKKLLTTKENGVLFSLIILLGIFAYLSENFLSLATFGPICSVSAEIGLIALGATILMIVGEFDLSIGSTFAMCGMIFAILSNDYELNSWVALIAALFCGGLIGLLNGLITIRTGIPSFITTLGSMLFLRGLCADHHGRLPHNCAQQKPSDGIFGL